MVDPSRAIVRPTHAIELQRARAEIPWIPETDLRALERKDPSTAWALSLFFGGGGQVYVGEYLKGIGLIAAIVALFAAPIPAWLGWPLWLATGLVSSLFAARKARAVNRYVAARDEMHREHAPVPAAYKLLAAQASAEAAMFGVPRMPPPGAMPMGPPMPTAPPSPHAELMDQLRKIALLHAQGVLNAVEFRDRKQDALEHVPVTTRKALDELLFELLPLREEGVLDQEDFEFLKALGARG